MSRLVFAYGDEQFVCGAVEERPGLFPHRQGHRRSHCRSRQHCRPPPHCPRLVRCLQAQQRPLRCHCQQPRCQHLPRLRRSQPLPTQRLHRNRRRKRPPRCQCRLWTRWPRPRRRADRPPHHPSKAATRSVWCSGDRGAAPAHHPAAARSHALATVSVMHPPGCRHRPATAPRPGVRPPPSRPVVRANCARLPCLHPRTASQSGARDVAHRL